MSQSANFPKPSVTGELRAWIGVGIVLLVNIVGGVWWAATLSTELRQMHAALAEIKAQMADRYTAADAARDSLQIRSRIDDHEGRLRTLERKP